TYNSFVRKSQLTARFVACPHNGLLVDHVIYGGPACGLFRILQLNVISYLGDSRFTGRSGVQLTGEPGRRGRGDRYENQEAKLPVHRTLVEGPNSGGLFDA